MKKVNIGISPIEITYVNGLLIAVGMVGEGICLVFELEIGLDSLMKTLGYSKMVRSLNSICEEDISEQELWRLFEIKYNKMNQVRVYEGADPEIVMN